MIKRILQVELGKLFNYYEFQIMFLATINPDMRFLI